MGGTCDNLDLRRDVYDEKSIESIDFQVSSHLRLFLQKVNVERHITHNMLGSRSLESERSHVNVLIDGQSRPLSLQQREANAARRNFRAALEGKDEVHARASADVDILVLVEKVALVDDRPVGQRKLVAGTFRCFESLFTQRFG